ncbi:MAG: protein kinase [Bryobacteraceae bacterium]|jgi:serine/threonine protein kinase
MVRELIVIGLDGRPRRVSLDGALITIGRSATCDLAFPDSVGLSRQHAAIRQDGDAWSIADLGSKNGTFLNGRRLAGAAPLSEGDRIQMGDVTVIADGENEAARSSILAVETPERVPQGGNAVLIFPGRRLSVTVTDPTPFAFGRASTLFQATAGQTGRVCIKLFPQVKGVEWESVAAFEREVLAQTTLNHPNILPVLDYGLKSEPHGSPFVILPYCDGGSVRSLIRERSFYPLSAVSGLLEQVAAGLDFAHASGFIHGDVKPENILLSADRTHAYLSDFGMSNVFAIQERFSTRVPGDPGGTTAFLSPEQISQNQQTALSDIYAFAMVAYELLTGKLPFDQDLPPFRQMTAKVEGRILDPRSFSPLITEEMKSALLVGLHRDPLERPRSATAFCRLLRGAAYGTPRDPARELAGRKTVFVSYSHRDSEWLDRIRVHLRPIERQRLIQLWDDTRIRPGQEWRKEIERSLESAACAILLVSPHFLASDFCTAEEIPRLLEGARDRGVKILPVIISPCRFQETPDISVFQAVNSPSRTLAEMPGPERDRTLIKLVEAVHRSLGSNAGDE